MATTAILALGCSGCGASGRTTADTPPLAAPDTAASAAPTGPGASPEPAPAPSAQEDEDAHIRERLAALKQREAEEDERMAVERDAAAARLVPVVGDRRGAFSTRETRFEDVVADIAKRFGVNVRIDEAVGAEVRDVPISMEFKDIPLSQVLVTIGALSGSRPAVDGDGIVFRKYP